MENKIEIVFASGKKMKVPEMNGEIFGELQEKYKYEGAIIEIDGAPSAIWGMNKEEIEKEFKRIRK